MGMFDRYLFVKIITAEPEKIFSRLSNDNVELFEVTSRDPLTFDAKIRKQQLRDFAFIINKTGASYSISGRKGMLWGFHNIWKRPILLVGIMMLIIISSLIQNRVLFIKVSGNDTVATQLILSKAEECGICFGANTSLIRSEAVKNQLMGNIPELQWVGINISGTVAEIQVSERSEKEEQQKQENVVSSVVACRDGIITEMTVEKGYPLFSVGQSVKTGDVLVSGYTDCGIKIIAQSAKAEVFAYTMHQNRFILPAITFQRGENTQKQTCYKLRVGKKVINLCNHSGISDATCVKMYSENYWTLPGGFQLPVSLIKVEHYSYRHEESEYLDESSCQWLPQFARAYLQKQMIAGEILDETLHWSVTEDACELTGRYACNEMIGQVKYEEIIEHNAEDN